MPGTGRNTSDLNLGEERRLAFLLAAPSLTAFFKETTWPDKYSTCLTKCFGIL